MAWAYGIRQGLRLWLLAVVVIGVGACRGSIDGGGGIDVGSAMVDVSFAPAKPREGVLDARLDGIDPIAPAPAAAQAVSVSAAFWGFKDMRFGTSEDCHASSDTPAGIKETLLPFDSVVIWPSGVVVPPAFDLEVTGVELCYVQFTFARSSKYETFVVNAVLGGSVRAVYVSDHPFVVRAAPETVVHLPDVPGEFALAVSVETSGWFEGADNWNLLGDDYYWSGGREQEMQIRRNIVSGMRASLTQVVHTEFGTATTATAMALSDHSYDLAIDP